MRIRLLIRIFMSGLAAAFVGNFLVTAMIAFATAGPLGLPGSVLLGFLSLGLALQLTALPAMLLGGLLWACHVHRAAIWAATGAIGGLGCYALAFALPGDIGAAAATFFQPGPVHFAPAFAIAGALAALLFRTLMHSVADHAEALDAD